MIFETEPVRSLLLLFTAVVAPAQVQKLATLPLPSRSLAVDSAGNIYTAGTALLRHHDRSISLPALNEFRNRSIVTSSDGGATWYPIGDLPTQEDVEIIDADPWTPGTLLINSSIGIWKTSDSGTHWRNTGIVDRGGIIYDPFVRGHILSGHLYSVDGGETWSNRIMLNDQSCPLAFHPRGNGTILQAGIDQNYISKDGGRTWAVKPPVALNHSIDGIVFDLTHPEVVYAWSGDFYRSSNGGENFDRKAA